MTSIYLRLYLMFLFSFLISSLCVAQTSYDIRLNQIGYLPNAIKYAAVVNQESNTFSIKTADLTTTVFTGELSSANYWTSADENVKIADFSLFNQVGEYVVVIEGLGHSVSFLIHNEVFVPLSKALIKAFYYTRASCEILPEYGGKFARAAGHPDTAVVVHPSGASASRPAGTIISTPCGWYDAGDYNKYVVNSGISTFTLLSAYETYSEYYDTLSWNIPESHNDIPDILDEAMWNIKWLMTMQDPEDGGVYNKVSTSSFEHQVKPSEAVMTRYVITKTTAAALDFAAVMAMAARIYQPFMPELAAKVLEQSKFALAWAKAHPNIPFSKPQASGIYPSISTGSYGDEYFDDEFAWCAAELYITTGNDQYYTDIQLNSDSYDVPNSGSVRTLGLLSLLVNKNKLTAIADTTLAKQKLLSLIKSSKSNTISTPYRIPGECFGWGGNGIYANKGMLLLQAYRLSNDAGYYNAALATFDYLLGKNATTYCFVTGAGSKSPMHIHHRISNSDGIADPIPGLMAGGPNPGDVETDCGAAAYPSLLPAKAYNDASCSYTTNEVAINWNSPMVFLAGGIQSEYLNKFIENKPTFISASTNAINFPSDSGSYANIIMESNVNWYLSSNVNWLSFSSTSGLGRTEVKITSNENNPGNEDRKAFIYVLAINKVIDTIYVTQNGNRKNFRLEAENYIDMYGLQTENTIDVDGKMNLGYVDVGDWVLYNLDVSFSGVYKVTIRHAGMAGGFDILIDEIKIKSVTVPATSDWQDWVSHSFELPLLEGNHKMKLLFSKQGLNINWYDFNWLRELDAVGNLAFDTTNGIIVFPNPSNDFITIKSEISDIKRIQIFSLQGQLLINQEVNKANAANIDVSKLNSGVYLVKTILKNSAINYCKILVNQ